MKKIVTLFLTATLACFGLAACSNGSATNESSVEKQTVNVAALKGPTSMGLVECMDTAEKDTSASIDYNFEILGSPDEMVGKITQNSADIACLPANMASVLYNKTEGDIEVLGINTLGVLYIVDTNDSVKTVEDLKGKTIYAAGKGATPQYALQYILQASGIDPEKDCSIEWKSEHSECVAALMQNEKAVALLPQPFVSAAQVKNDKIHVAIDLNQEWSFLQKLKSSDKNATPMVTGVVVAHKDFVKEHPEVIKDFMNRYKKSVDFVNNNVDSAAELIGSYDIVPAPVAKKAIPQCNIVCITGSEMKEDLSSYLNELYEQNPKAIGGKLPLDDFYYEG